MVSILVADQVTSIDYADLASMIFLVHLEMFYPCQNENLSNIYIYISSPFSFACRLRVLTMMTESSSHVPVVRRPDASSSMALMALSSFFHSAFEMFLVTNAGCEHKFGTFLYHCLEYHASRMVLANSGV